MRYFIESVTTYSTTGKSRKGALLQTIVTGYEHAVLADEHTLARFIRTLRLIVDACNKTFSGSTLYLSVSDGYISVHPQSTGSEAHVVTIHYAPIGFTYETYSVAGPLVSSVENLATPVARALDELAEQEGGER